MSRHIGPACFGQAKSSSGGRATQTRIVNGALKKTPNGRYDIDWSSPIFQEAKEKYEKKYFRDEQKGLPKTLAVAACGGKQAFEEALANGELKQFDQDGVQYFAWRQMKCGRERGITTFKTTMSKHNISSEAYDKIGEVLDSLSWNFNFTQAQLKASRVFHATCSLWSTRS